MRDIDLSVIVVSWNTRDLLRDCLASIFRETPREGLEVIAVDNASEDGSPAMMAADFPAVRLIQNPSNLGFARANNIGISASRGSLILLLNPDTVVLDGAVDKMARFMSEHDDAGAVCPKVLNADGSVQSLGRRLPNLGRIAMQCFFPFEFHRLLSAAMSRIRRREKGPVLDVEGMPGAVMMIRREILNRIGLMDESLPLYGEDIDLCRRIRDAGGRILCLSDLRIIHHMGQSTGQAPVSSQVEGFKALHAFMDKHGSPGAARLVKWMIKSAAVFRFLAWTILGAAAGSETRRLAPVKTAVYRELIEWKPEPVFGRETS